jgi:pimeloyl-ACP methyl ester carboxylesterase
MEKVVVDSKKEPKILVEGIPFRGAENIILLVHGFGTDLHERGFFDEISKALQSSEDTAVIRFNFPKIETEDGVWREKSLEGMADDLQSVLDYIDRKKKGDASFIIIGFSMGNYVIAKCFSAAILIRPAKIILINPPRIDFKKELQNYFQNKPGAKIDDNDIWTLPREDGSITYVGPEFWNSIRAEEQSVELKNLTERFPTYLIKATGDELVGEAGEIEEMPFKKIINLKGGHNFSKPEDRANFIGSLTALLKG